MFKGILVKQVDSVNVTPPSKSLDKIQYLLNTKIYSGKSVFPDEVKIKVDLTVQRIIQPARRVPRVIAVKMKIKLKRMKKVNFKIKEPTQWVNFQVIAENQTDH